MQQRVMERLADRIDEIREFLGETDNDLLAAEFIAKTVCDIEGQLVIEDWEGRDDLGDVVYGTGC